jgi:transposase, IS5 family
VIEADVKYPTDAGLASSGVKVLAREGRKLVRLIRERMARVRDRSRAMGHKLRTITRTVRRRSGEAKQEVLKLTGETGELLERSIKEARRLAKIARGKARGRGARAKLKAAAALEEMADRCEKVARQIKQRVAGKPIKDRIVSLHDPDARPIRKGKLGKPNEFGYVSQLAEVTQRLGIRVQEAAFDGGFNVGPTNSALEDLYPKNVFIAGRQEPGSKRTTRRMRRYRTGAEGRISHLKRRYGLDRSRLKGDEGREIWTEWAILAYNADTLAVRER